MIWKLTPNTGHDDVLEVIEPHLKWTKETIFIDFSMIGSDVVPRQFRMIWNEYQLMTR